MYNQMHHAFTPLKQQVDDTVASHDKDCRISGGGEILNFDSIEAGGSGLDEDGIRPSSTFEGRLRGIFSQHDPDKLHDVPKLLKKFAGGDHEAKLISKLEEKVWSLTV